MKPFLTQDTGLDCYSAVQKIQHAMDAFKTLLVMYKRHKGNV